MSVIMGLFRKVILIVAVVTLAPTSMEEAAQDANAVIAGAFRAVDVVMMTVRDVSGFCDRNPAVCGGGEADPAPMDIRTMIEAEVGFTSRSAGPQEARRISPAPAAPLR